MKIGGGYSSSSTSNAFENTGTTSGSSATSATKLPDQLATAPDIFAVLHQYLTNPQGAVNPARMQARNQVNSDFAGSADRIRQKFLTTGGGQSGKSGRAILDSELARSGKLADVDNSAAVEAAQLPLTATQLAEAFLGINMGQSTTGNQTTANKGTSQTDTSGWQVGGSAGWSPAGGFSANG